MDSVATGGAESVVLPGASGRWGRWGPAARGVAVVVAVAVALGLSFLCWFVLYVTVLKPDSGPAIPGYCTASSVVSDVASQPASGDGVFRVRQGSGVS